jgi:UDP-N-acetylglucosamine acyltransferase
MISPLAYVDPSAKLGENVTVHPFAYIEGDVEIGDGCEILPYASILNGTRMGKNNKVYQGAIVGAEPQDFRWKVGDKTYCYIGDNNHIREQVIINRGIKEQGGTKIGNNNFILAMSHIGHDCNIYNGVVLGNGVTLAGHVSIDKCSILSSNVIVHENSRIGRWALIKGGCRISGNVPPYVIMAHNPTAYFGVNAIIMSKVGQFSEDEIDDAAKAYRHVYQASTSIFNAVKRIEKDLPDGRIRRQVLKFINENDMKLCAMPIDATIV